MQWEPITQISLINRNDGVYKIDAGSGEVTVFCVLSDLGGCRGGFTLVMKLDGRKASVRLESSDPSTGNRASWFPDNGMKNTKTFGYILVQ